MSTEDLTPDRVRAEAFPQTDSRAESLKKTYLHGLGAILAFASLEYGLFQTPNAAEMAVFMLEKSWIAVLASASILYGTSRMLKVYPKDRYIAAALELLASSAMTLWYVPRLFLSRR